MRVVLDCAVLMSRFTDTFSVNPNQWGWDASEGGGLCMNVSIASTRRVRNGQTFY